jgi:hypothetical protein
MKPSVVIVLAVLALLMATAVGGCSKKKPKNMDEVREKDAQYWKDRWARKQREEAAAGAEEPAAQGPAVGRSRPNASPMQVAPEGGSSPGMTEADEEAEADRDMPGTYE